MPPKVVKVKQTDTYTKLKINGQKVAKRTFQVTNGKPLDKSDIVKLVKEQQEKYKHKNLNYLVTIDTPYGYRNGKIFYDMSDPNFPDKYDWDDVTNFVIYAWVKTSPSVGNDEHNDCLFKSIASIVSVYRFPKNIKKADEFKRLLGLGRDSKIPLKVFPKVEDLLKVNINCDEHYVSPNKYKLTANLELEGIDHIKPKKHNAKSNDLIKSIQFREQQLILCEELKDDVRCYNGDNIFYMNYDEYREKKHEIFGDVAYIEATKVTNKYTSHLSLEEKYDWYINEINLLKELSHGKIDLSRSGYKCVSEALKTIYYSLLCYEDPEPLTEQEQYWFYKSFKGGLLFTDKVELENAYCYDKNSAYPSKMIDQYFQFPVKQGVFSQLDKLPDVIPFGIFRCVISKCENEHINKLFYFNEDGYYTHYDVTCAKELGLEIKLVPNVANALLYSSGRAYGSQYFGQVIDSLYQFKKQSKLAKCIINDIWGALCIKNKIERTTLKPLELDNVIVLSIAPLKNGLEKVKYLTSGKYYKYDYARLGCFLTSAVRKEMALTILPIKENVFRCHTDSIVSNIPLSLPISDKIGEWKLEHQGYAKLMELNQPLGKVEPKFVILS